MRVSALTKHYAHRYEHFKKSSLKHFLITATWKAQMESPTKNSWYCCFHYFLVSAGLVMSFLISFVVVFIPLGWLLKLWEIVTNLSCLANCVLHNRLHANLTRKFFIILSVGILIDKTGLSCLGDVYSVNLWVGVCRWDTEIPTRR